MPWLGRVTQHKPASLRGSLQHAHEIEARSGTVIVGISLSSSGPVFSAQDWQDRSKDGAMAPVMGRRTQHQSAGI